MSTQSRSFPTAEATRRRAFYGSFAVAFVGAAEWEVESRASGTEYRVMLRDGRFECDCPSYNYDVIHGPRDHCKHSRCVAAVVNDEVCPHCTMPRCRPSCPNRSDS
ncbi:hypothetical protein C2R22_05810 [Salinigranum rubrum]|uniref:SWIM-type domain-containing protein n=1 Tax=Salinigranum rubrum TaxID=755307 RepID=A0A2I8VH24_9EURY|nr:hypothetical protein [Salinigranum rubrum]AUV81233.1 hypothetical protein C2R22_05810 [Salinigranum rubrum]